MYKVGIIGKRDSVLGFMALGFSIHEAESVEAAREMLHTLAKSGEYAVIFMTEEFALALSEDRDKYKDMPLPAICVIPSSEGSRGYGMDSIKQATIRAVGADILFGDDE